MLRSSAWTARGLRTPGRYVGVAERTPTALLGRAYGAERAAEHLGAVGGPLAALALVSAVGVRAAILLSIVPGALAVLAIVHSGRAVSRAGNRERLSLRVRPLVRGRLGWTFAAIGAFECSNLAVTLLILRSTNLLAPHFGRLDATRITLALYALYRLTAALACRPAGRSTDRRGAVGPFAAGATVLLVSYAGFALASADVVLLGACFVLAGAATGVVETAEYALVARRSPAPLYAASFGLLTALQGAGKLGASTITGVLWVLVAPQAGLAWAAPAVAVCVSCLVRASRAREERVAYADPRRV